MDLNIFFYKYNLYCGINSRLINGELKKKLKELNFSENNYCIVDYKHLF
jgi:hypothetical protein